MQAEGLKAFIFGSTGAIGAELVSILLADPKWSKVHCVVRKTLDEWNTLPGKEKLSVEVFENLDDYFKQENNKYKGFDSMFCCFGSQVKHGEETFVKVDKTYPLWAADIAIANKIPHYLLFSSKGGDASSWFLYMKTKGQVEEQMKKKNLNYLSILKPGILRNRRDARTMEKVIGVFPFFPGIQARDSAHVMRILAERYHEQAAKSKGVVKVYENSDMVNIIKSENK